MGADPRIAADHGDGDEETALECAARWGYEPIVSLLLDSVSWYKQEKGGKRSVRRALKASGGAARVKLRSVAGRTRSERALSVIKGPLSRSMRRLGWGGGGGGGGGGSGVADGRR